jgi:hypothetical protein
MRGGNKTKSQGGQKKKMKGERGDETNGYWKEILCLKAIAEEDDKTSKMEKEKVLTILINIHRLLQFVEHPEAGRILEEDIQR